MEVENVSSRRKIGSVKFSEKRGEKNSIEFDSISHLLDIHLDRGVINEGDSTRVRFEQTRNHSFVPRKRGSNSR